MLDTLSRQADQLQYALEPLRSEISAPFLLAIDGRSGTGKSCFAEALAARNESTLISGDDFFAGGVLVQDLSAEALADRCINRAKLRCVLEQLKSGQQTSFAAFDWDRFDGALRLSKTRLQPRPLLILEGVYSFHPDLRDLVDYSVLIEASETIRQQRLLQREGEITDWERQWHRAEDWYFSALAPNAQFDRVLRNDDYGVSQSG